MNHRPTAQKELPGRIAGAGERWPRGMRRDDAAAYLGISTSKFDDWVTRGIMPQAKRQDGVKVWDRYSLDQAFELLPDAAEETSNSWAHLDGGDKFAAR
jgi:hypothetical protein